VRTLEALQEQQGLLDAAEALEKRALAIHDWPIDEGTLGVITITTTVIASMIARLLVHP
jgi:hypothetical protein